MATRDRTVLVRLKANATDFNRAMVGARASVRGLRDEIDTTNDRTAWLAQGILALGPTLAPIGAAAVPVLTGLATQMTAVGLAAGVTGLAFNGVGDALGALNDYQLEPTNENLEDLTQALAKIGPEGEEFVRFIDSLGPQFAELSNIAREEMFPRMTKGIKEFMDLMPQVAAITQEVAQGVGRLTINTGKGLNNERFEAFFNYLEETAKPTLIELGHTFGNIFEGFASILVAFGPLSSDFSSGLMSMTDSFADWAAGLSDTDSFAEFVAYIRDAGPKVLDFLGSFSTAFLEVMEAAAPIGDVMLPVLSNLFDVIARLADTPLGPAFLGIAAAMSLYGRAAALASITTGGLGGKMLALSRSNAQTAFSFKGLGTNLGVVTRNMLTAGAASDKMRASTVAAAGPLKAQGKAIAGFAGQAALLGVAMSGASEKVGLTNTVTMALAGSLGGPAGTAIGAGAGALMDLSAAGSEAHTSMVALNSAVESGNINDITAAITRQKDALEDYNDVDWKSPGDILESIGSAIGDTFRGDFTNTTAAQEKAIEAAKKHKVAMQDAAERSRDLDVAMARSAESAEAQAHALRAAREAASKTAQSFLEFGDSIDDAEVSLGDWITEMAKSADALNNFRANAEKAANRGLRDGLIAKLQELGPAGALRMKQLANASDRELGRANRAFGKTERAAGRYAHALDGIPRNVKTDIELREEAAASALAAFQAKVDYATRRRIIVIDVQGRGVLPGQIGISADGGTVPKTGLPYADRHPYLLADGEEVVSNRRGQADKNRYALKAANAGAKLAVVGYADGGTAGKRPGRAGLDFMPDLGEYDTLGKAIKGLSKAVEKQTTMLSDAESARNAVLSKMGDLASATIAHFNTGLFERDDRNAWAPGSGGGGALSNLRDDIATGNQRELLQNQLKALGLEGDALATLLKEGSNADIAGMIARGEIGEYRALYDQRAALQERVGSAAGEMAYGEELAQSNAHLAAMLAEVREMKRELRGFEKAKERREAAKERAADRRSDRNAEKVSDGVRSSASKGHRDRRGKGK